MEGYFQCLTLSALKAALKNQHFLRKIQFPGYIVAAKGIQPVAKKVQELKTTRRATKTKEM